MPYSITTKDGITINNIPDDVAPDAQVLKDRVAFIRAGGGSAALEAPQEPSGLQQFGSEVGRQIGLTGRGAIEGVTGLAGLVIDPVTRLANMALPASVQIPTMQQATAEVLNTAGFPQPRDAVERVVNQALQGMAGGGGMAATGRALAGAASPVTAQVGQMLATAPGLQIASGGTAMAGGEIAKESGAGTVGQIAASLAGAAVPFSPQIARSIAQQTAQAVAPKGAGILKSAEPTIGESVESIGATIKEKVAPKSTEEISATLKTDPANVDVVKYKLSGAQVLPDKLAANVLKQGWKDGAVASIKASTDNDKRAMTQMLNIFKLGDKNEKFRAMNRPADVLGKSVDNRIKFLTTTKDNAGKEIDKIAQTQLKGQQINFDPAINSFVDDLGKIGVKVELDKNGIAKAVLKDSDIQGDKQAQRILNIVLERLSNVKTPDAYGIHTAKRFIDTQVSYGKKNLSNPLSAQAERTLKNLRSNLNHTLGDANPNYREANTAYSDTIDALDNMQKAAGTNIDFDSPNADKAFGQAMRKLLSNYGSRVNMIDSIDNVNQTAAKYGMNLDDDVVNQLIFVNELDRMFGAAADMTFKGQVSQGIRTGLDVARGNAAERAFDLLAQKAESLRGINKENAIKAMEELLKNKQPL